jgi:hypothetical protein
LPAPRAAASKGPADRRLTGKERPKERAAATGRPPEGLQTHDVGDIYEPLEPGVVLTVEPGIYIPEEAIGIRIEDVVVITADGHRNMSANIPRTIEEVESAMRRR